MACPCCQPECESNDDCDFGECCVDNQCKCTCASILGIAAMEGMTVTFEGKEFVVGAPNTSSTEAIECDPPDDEQDCGFWDTNTLFDDAFFSKTGIERCGIAQFALVQNKYATIRCIFFPAEGCPYWQVEMANTCRECIPDAEEAPFDLGIGRQWYAKVAMDENCLPIGEPYDVELIDETILSIGGAGDCDPQPPSISYGNPLP